MIFPTPYLILPPEKPALIRALDLTEAKTLAARNEGAKVAWRSPVLGNFPFPVFCPSGLVIATAFSETLNANDGDASGYSMRSISPALSAGGTQIRATFRASTAAGWIVAHNAIGISSGSGATTATPVELLQVGGASGHNISASGLLTTDWALLSTTLGVTQVVAISDTTSGANRALVASAMDMYQKAGTSSYNSSSAAGFTHIGAHNNGISLIEVR